jgi:hypothetical protein
MTVAIHWHGEDCEISLIILFMRLAFSHLPFTNFMELSPSIILIIVWGWRMLNTFMLQVGFAQKVTL